MFDNIDEKIKQVQETLANAESFSLRLTKAEAQAITEAWALVAAVLIRSPEAIALVYTELSKNHMASLRKITEKMHALCDTLDKSEN